MSELTFSLRLSWTHLFSSHDDEPSKFYRKWYSLKTAKKKKYNWIKSDVRSFCHSLLPCFPRPLSLAFAHFPSSRCFPQTCHFPSTHKMSSDFLPVPIAICSPVSYPESPELPSPLIHLFPVPSNLPLSPDPCQFICLCLCLTSCVFTVVPPACVWIPVAGTCLLACLSTFCL